MRKTDGERGGGVREEGGGGTSGACSGLNGRNRRRSGWMPPHPSGHTHLLGGRGGGGDGETQNPPPLHTFNEILYFLCVTSHLKVSCVCMWGGGL